MTRLQFGDCGFDASTRELFRAGKPAHLSPKAFHLLELLIDNRPRALSKAEIHEKIWPDAFVSEATLASLIAEIRQAIGETGSEHRVIRTVHGYGYAFQANVTTGGHTPPRPAAAARVYRLIWQSRAIALSEGENVLGRDSDATVCIEDPSVSRRRILVSGDSAHLEDLDSKNGTFVGDVRVEKERELSDGDEIRLGKVSLVIRAGLKERSTVTQIEDTGKPPR
ncbi:MAG: winged helix-turn-helix domain-containing protein [Thermoanaerobaculia bacterium]|nr:winged helix-turn-helix domain-containing protein [Thermoanaerobaculia bacterium]